MKGNGGVKEAVAKVVAAWLRQSFEAEFIGGAVFIAPKGFWNRIRLKFARAVLPRETMVYLLPELKDPTGKFLRAFQKDELHGLEKLAQGLGKESLQETQEREHKPSKQS
jgi:hypothetical protein